MVAPYIAITVICYGISEVVKSAKLVCDEYIPLVSVFIGILCSIISIVYGFNIGGGNAIDIFAIGISSGLAAVGINQIPKQIKKAVEK